MFYNLIKFFFKNKINITSILILVKNFIINIINIIILFNNTLKYFYKNLIINITNIKILFNNNIKFFLLIKII